MKKLSGFDADWFVFRRVQDVGSAFRVNAVRGLAITAFFSILLFNHFRGEPTEEQVAYLWKSAKFCGIWLGLTLAVAIGLQFRTYPPIYKYGTTLCDAILLTAICGIGAMAESTLVLGYFIIVASAFLRYSKLLILFTTVICLLGYLTLVYETPHYWDREPDQPFPYIEVFRVCCGLIVMGLIGLQLCAGCKDGLYRAVRYAKSEGSHE